jgi:prepilin peptidase CpaA
VAAHPLLFVFPFAMAYAALMDIFTMRIANGVSIAVGVAFLIVAPIAGMPAQEVLMHLGVGAGMLVVGMILFAFGALGGGDAKLLAAASLWVGPAQWLPFIALVAVFGGVLAVVIVMFRKYPARALMLPPWALRLHQTGGSIPYGVAIAAGALFIYPTTPWPALLATGS